MKKQCLPERSRTTGSKRLLGFLLELVLLLFVGLHAAAVKAQNSESLRIKGIVVDSNDPPKPLVGVTILIKGTQKGVSTDAEGFFAIEAPKDAILEFRARYLPIRRSAGTDRLDCASREMADFANGAYLQRQKKRSGRGRIRFGMRQIQPRSDSFAIRLLVRPSQTYGRPRVVCPNGQTFPRGQLGMRQSKLVTGISGRIPSSPGI